MHQDMTITHVVVDGSNIATEGHDAPSLAQLDEAVQAFIEEFAPEHVTVVVDATFPNRIDRKERKTYEDAVNANELITPPAGAIGRGDAFILQIARRANAAILSNDSFQEFHGEFPWLFERGRLIGGKPVPHVGWVFMDRAPVRGPTSRRAVSEARKVAKPSKVTKATEAAAERVAADATGAGDDAPPPRRRRSRAKAPVDAVPVETPEETTGDGDRSDLAPAKFDDEPAEGGARGRGGRSPEPYNEALPFIEFVAAHPVGSEVEATIERFSSHGAYVLVDSARAYVPLRNLADPAPRSAKEVVRLGEQRRFVVVAVDTPRRGIDLALPGVVPVPAAEPGDMAAVLAEMDADRIDEVVVDAAGAAVEGDAGVSETPPTRGRGRGRAAAKAPAEKATRSAGARKSAAKKAAARKAPARKAATAPAVDDAAHDAVPTDASETDAETAARKTAAGRSSAKKAAAQKAPARKAAAKRAAGDEPPTEKPARTAAARKATAGQAPEKTAAKKSTARKAAAKKTAAKRTGAKRTAARKAPARQAAADEPGADARVVPLVTDSDAAPEAAEG